MDMVTITNTSPEKGETVIGDKLSNESRRKGANQAVAASRLGAEELSLL